MEKLKKIHQLFETEHSPRVKEERIQRLCTHLQGIGLKAEVSYAGSSGDIRTGGGEVVGRITVNGQEFDEILVTSYVKGFSPSHSGTT